MTFTAHATIMPLRELLDPQGKAVNSSLHNLGLTEVENVRIGKHITLTLNAENKEAAEKRVREACEKLLANAVMESFEITVE